MSERVITPDVEKTLSTLLLDHQKYHSALQMDSFITTRAGSYHPYGMYVQCLRELNGRYYSLRQKYIEDEEIEVKELALRSRIRRWCWTLRQRLSRRLLELELRKLAIAREGSAQGRADKEREFKRFLAQALVLKERVGDLSEERREELDRDLWVCRLKQKLAIDLIREGVPSSTFYEVLPTLPGSMRVALWKALADPKETVEWFEQLGSPESPDTTVRISSEDLRRLISA